MLRGAMSAAIMISVALMADLSGLTRHADNWFTGIRMASQTRAPSGETVLVDIDAKSIEAMGSWPWPRRVHAELIDRLVALDAAEIAFDVDFSAPSNADDDAALEAALGRAGGSVILAVFRQWRTADADDGDVLNQPLDRFAKNAWTASVNACQDSDGVVRRYPYGAVVDDLTVPSIPVMLAGGQADGDNNFIIDFGIDAGAIDRFSVIDVLRGNVARDGIAGKKVIVGAQAAELRDFFNVPGGRVVSGSLLQALAAETLLQGHALHETSTATTVAGLLLLALLAFLIGRIHWLASVAAVALASVSVEIAAALTQSIVPIVITTAAWHLALLTLGLAVLVYEIDFRRLMHLVWHARAKNAETMLSQVVADNFAGIVVINSEGRISAVSRAAAQMLGFQDDPTGMSAADFLPPVLMGKIESALGKASVGDNEQTAGEVLFHREDGEMRTFDFVVTVSQFGSESTGKKRQTESKRLACLTFSDVTDKRAAEAKIAHMARFDTLTNLPNRNRFVERLEWALARARNDGSECAVVCFDLDNFKNINDTLSHGIGDRLLCAVAKRAADMLPADGLIARLGGDEFAAVFAESNAGQTAEDYARRLIGEISEPFEINSHRVIVAASAGVAKASPLDAGVDDPLKRADTALYRAKAEGGNSFVIFEPSMLEAIARRHRLELELWQAFEANQFEVWYQPQVNFSNGDLCGVEALVRWRHPERGIVSPAEFIPVAEAIGLMESLGRWVLETACLQAAGWPEHIKLAVNVSSAQFARSNMVATVSDALGRSNLSPSRLDLEITESLFMQPIESVHSALSQIRAFGVGIALDDFGTGYSSLSYIHKFPIDKIKIDQSFVAGLPNDDDSLAIVRAVAALSSNLGIRLNAEGIENIEQANSLRLLGVAEGQGYLYGRPQKPSEIGHLLASGSLIHDGHAKTVA